MIKKFIEYVNINHLGKINESLSFKNLTTLKIGGNILCTYYPKNLDSLYHSMKYLKENHIPYFVLGKGSNILASDKTCTKVVIQLDELSKVTQISSEKFLVEAGVIGSKFSFEMAKAGYTKMEFLSTIPGTIGGQIYMNAGAYGKEMADIIEEVTYIDKDGRLKTKKKEELEFGYRSSIFQKTDSIIVSAIFKLVKVQNANLPLELIRTYKQTRREQQPINQNTAGSTFQNFEHIKAWELIDLLGLRGLNINDAAVSNKHANFLVNQKNAKYEDMIELIKVIQEKVKKAYNLDLVCEWVIVE